ncbi:MAG: ATP-binding protein [Thermodesulfobacteriota bacterium]
MQTAALFLKRRSMRRNLSVSLVLTIMAVSACVGALLFHYSHLENERALHDKAAEMAGNLGDILGLPLWNLDEMSVAGIVDAYLQNDIVASLRIADTTGNIRAGFTRRGGDEEVVTASRPVVHEAEVVGEVTLSLSRQPLQQARRQALLVTMLTMLFVILSVILATNAFLGRFLSGPLGRLTAGLESIARGDYAMRLEPFSQLELAAISTQANAMAEQIQSRDRKLRELIVELERHIAELNSTEEALRVSEENYRTIFENSLEGIFQTTPAGRILNVNTALARMLGYDSPQEMIQATRSVGQYYVDPARRDAFLAALAKAGRLSDFEAQLRTVSGEAIWVAMSSRIVRAEDGAVRYIEGFMRDITESRRALEAIRQAKEAAETASRMKSEFLCMVSHELRTPLTSVLGFAKQTAKKMRRDVLPALEGGEGKASRSAGQVLGNLEIIRGEAERLTRIINDVIDLTKLQAGCVEWRTESLDPSELVDRALGVASPLAAQKSLSLRAEFDGDAVPINGDRTWLVQALVNLLANAVKFTDSGEIVCRVELGDDEVVLSVRDTGRGIAPENLGMIFEQFKQLGDILTEKPSGAGLGLAICKQIVESHGGRIWAESELGVGSVFRISLPLG